MSCCRLTKRTFDVAFQHAIKRPHTPENVALGLLSDIPWPVGNPFYRASVHAEHALIRPSVHVLLWAGKLVRKKLDFLGFLETPKIFKSAMLSPILGFEGFYLL